MPRDLVLAQAIGEHAIPLVGAHADFDQLLERIGDARFVLLGEATHGSHEFYHLRAELTKRLIREKGFAAVAIEGDWPDAYRINRYVRGFGRDLDAAASLTDFRRFPQWMWRNADVIEFVRWLRDYNTELVDPRGCVGFYGLDLYSLHASMAAVLMYLDTRDPAAAHRARERYACFDAFGAAAQQYGQLVSLGMSADCEREVIEQLCELVKRRNELLRHDSLLAEDLQFEAEQNALVVANAEAYYREMYLGGGSTWNLRDTHMADTLDALAVHLRRYGRNSKVVVWAHNSHVGDSTAMAHRSDCNEITIGHLCRARHRNETVLVGFTTYEGTVTAASDWDGDAERKVVCAALPDSFEALFHRTGVPSFLLMLDNLGEAAAALHEPRLERAIGVVYRPQTERWSHYFDVRLAEQVDAVVHVDHTSALEPMERTPLWVAGEYEMFPTGLQRAVKRPTTTLAGRSSELP
jgi:erythromycin esterase-like protein